ncbi:MAG: TauD/TfdA family dioxygenase [Pseudomonadota bacterium]
MQIDTVSLSNGGITARWKSGEQQFFSAFWLRDHCDDIASQDSKTRQRLVDTFSIEPDIAVHSATLDSDSERVELRWHDSSRNTISISQLQRAAFSEQQSSAGERRYWSASRALESLPEIAYEDVLSCEQGTLQWLELINRYGFAIVTGTEASEQGAETLGGRISAPQRTIFGTYWPLSADLSEHEDSAYSTQTLLPHTDGTYYHNASGLQMFNCLEFDGTGGESVLVDGFAIAAEMKEHCPEHFETLCAVSVPGQYLEPGVHLYAERPVIRLNSHCELQQVSFNNYDRAPMHMDENSLAAFYAAYAEFNRRSVDEANWLKIPLRAGMALIFDNWRCMHGRMGYSGKRTFYGCYHNRADYESRLRTLRQTVNATTKED